MARFLEERSAGLSGFAGKNSYGLTLHGQSEHFDELTDAFFATLLKPTFEEKLLDQERELFYRSLEAVEEDPLKQCFLAFQDVIFKDHPYSLRGMGTKETLKKFTSSFLSQRHAQTMQESKILFTYMGNLPIEEVISLITPHLQDLKPRKEIKLSSQKILPAKKTTINKHFNREQSHIIMGKQAYNIFDDNDLPLKLLAAYLSGQGSPLFTKVRDEMGLCYAVRPIHLTAMEGGYFGIYIGSGKDKVQLAMKAINEILQNLKEKGLSKKDFNSVKKMMDGQFQIGLETNEDYAGQYSIFEFYNLGIDHYYDNHKKLMNITHEQFNKFLKKFINNDFFSVIAGPTSSDLHPQQHC